METPRRQRAATADGETPRRRAQRRRPVHTPSRDAARRLERPLASARADAGTAGGRTPAAGRPPLPSAGQASHCTAGGRSARRLSRREPGAKAAQQRRHCRRLRGKRGRLSRRRPGGATSRGRSREPNTRPRRRVHSGFAQEAPAGSASRARQRRVRKREFVQQKIAERSTYATRMNLKNVTWSKRSLTRNDAQ